MSSVRKRKRKTCQKCGEEISDRHFRRHNCDGDDSEIDLLKDDQPIISSATEPKQGQSKNVADEDMYAFFDSQTQFENPDELMSSDEDIDNVEEDLEISDFLSEIDTYNEHDEVRLKESNRKKYILWILKILLNWQSAFFISDNALTYILILIKSVLYICSGSSDFVNELYSCFPSTLYQMNRLLGYQNDNFQKFVICIKCYALYKYEDCYHMVEGIDITKNCTNVLFPNHRLAYMRIPCGQPLLKCVKFKDGEKLLPYKSYCYKSIKDSFSKFVRRPNFEIQCEEWRDRIVPEDILMDIYDGEIWKEFCGEQWNYLSQQRNYALMLNVDWFQPFKYTNYSVGAVYLSVLNLPREERFKRKNVILVGLIPDMQKEPPTNSFIEPLVEELKEGWVGFQLKSYNSPDTAITFRLALLCVGCDIPASRKLSGFLGHAATMGCNKCTKAFPGMVGEKDYGGFDISNWVLRNNIDHRRQIREIVTAKTKADREKLEKQYGVRYSVLLELEYFDPVRMTILDPMHNLFLGTAKHAFHVMKLAKAFTDNDLRVIQNKVDMIQCPSDIGKLPQKLASSFGGFNADQWKNWTVIFSIFCLEGVLPDGDINCWRKFVLACKTLCTRVIRKTNVKIAQLQLLQFCKMFEQLYGKDRVTPNMHMHGHIEKCIIDYGPIYSFWLFSFERENGILGSIPSNKRDIEVQLMRKFIKKMNTVDILCDNDLVPDFGSDFIKCLSLDEDTDRGTLGVMGRTLDLSVLRMSSSIFAMSDVDWTVHKGITYGTLKQFSLKDTALSNLNKMYQFLYPETSFEMCPSYRSSAEVYVFGTVLGTKSSRSSRSSMILAHWCGQHGNISDAFFNTTPRPGQIEKFLIHNLIMNGKSQVHLLAKVKWFGELQDSLKHHYGKPVEVWRSDIFEENGASSFIPIQRIKSKFVYAFHTLQGKRVIIVCPRDRYLT